MYKLKKYKLLCDIRTLLAKHKRPDMYKMGVFKNYILVVKKNDVMKNILKTLSIKNMIIENTIVNVSNKSDVEEVISPHYIDGVYNEKGEKIQKEVEKPELEILLIEDTIDLVDRIKIKLFHSREHLLGGGIKLIRIPDTEFWRMCFYTDDDVDNFCIKDGTMFDCDMCFETTVNGRCRYPVIPTDNGRCRYPVIPTDKIEDIYTHEYLESYTDGTFDYVQKELMIDKIDHVSFDPCHLCNKDSLFDVYENVLNK